MKLYGHDWTRDELHRRSGMLRQLAGCTRYELSEGMERGVEICEVRTGSGFRFLVAPSRGLDIVYAEHNGRPLCWNSSTGVVHPAYFEDQHPGWLRGFYGGLMTTCGFSSFGSQCQDEGEHYGLHDRASYLPATNIATREIWEGDDCTFEVSGQVRETRVYGPNLLLTRTISARLGDDFFTVRDRLENQGFTPEVAVILYHCNFGFPVISEYSRIHAPSQKCEPRDDAAADKADLWMQMEEPQVDFSEKCYFHDMKPDADGFVQASIWNEKLNFGGYVRYRHETLPHFTQWKMMGAGTYVCGLEPSNAHLCPRSELRERGALPLLQPGESLELEVQLGALNDAPES